MLSIAATLNDWQMTASIRQSHFHVSFVLLPGLLQMQLSIVEKQLSEHVACPLLSFGYFAMNVQVSKLYFKGGLVAKIIFFLVKMNVWIWYELV